MTPEGRVKRKVSELLRRFPAVYSFMPVQHGLGASGLDYHCVVGMMVMFDATITTLPVAFFIETKKPGGELTERQKEFVKARLEGQNAITFVIDEDPSINKGKGLAELIQWLEGVERNNERIRAVIAQSNP